MPFSFSCVELFHSIFKYFSSFFAFYITAIKYTFLFFLADRKHTILWYFFAFFFFWLVRYWYIDIGLICKVEYFWNSHGGAFANIIFQFYVRKWFTGLISIFYYVFRMDELVSWTGANARGYTLCLVAAYLDCTIEWSFYHELFRAFFLAKNLQSKKI